MSRARSLRKLPVNVPTQIEYRQDYGLYQKGKQYLFISSGLGGLIPFRLGISPEIAVITLHKTKP